MTFLSLSKFQTDIGVDYVGYFYDVNKHSYFLNSLFGLEFNDSTTRRETLLTLITKHDFTSNQSTFKTINSLKSKVICVLLNILDDTK